VRRDSSTWAVNGHPASSASVNELLSALADSIRASEVVAERTGSHASFGVDTSGKRVHISGRKGPIAELVVGQRSTDLDGGYLRRAEDSVVYLVRGELAAVLGRGADEWRDRRIGGAAADSMAAIEVTRGRRAYTLRRPGGKWTLANGRPADSTAMGNLVGALAQVEAAGFASKAQADSARFSRPDRRLRVLRSDGTPLLALVFDSIPGGFWVRADSGGEVYRIESWSADRITPADSVVRGK
jgi:hypothetical protein